MSVIAAPAAIRRSMAAQMVFPEHTPIIDLVLSMVRIDVKCNIELTGDGRPWAGHGTQ